MHGTHIVYWHAQNKIPRKSFAQTLITRSTIGTRLARHRHIDVNKARLIIFVSIQTLTTNHQRRDIAAAPLYEAIQCSPYRLVIVCRADGSQRIRHCPILLGVAGTEYWTLVLCTDPQQRVTIGTVQAGRDQHIGLWSNRVRAEYNLKYLWIIGGAAENVHARIVSDNSYLHLTSVTV